MIQVRRARSSSVAGCHCQSVTLPLLCSAISAKDVVAQANVLDTVKETLFERLSDIDAAESTDPPNADAMMMLFETNRSPWLS